MTNSKSTIQNGKSVKDIIKNQIWESLSPNVNRNTSYYLVSAKRWEKIAESSPHVNKEGIYNETHRFYKAALASEVMGGNMDKDLMLKTQISLVRKIAHSKKSDEQLIEAAGLLTDIEKANTKAELLKPLNKILGSSLTVELLEKASLESRLRK